MYPEDSILMRAEELANIEKGFNRHSISTIVTVGFVTIAMGLCGAGVWQDGGAQLVTQHKPRFTLS